MLLGIVNALSLNEDEAILERSYMYTAYFLVIIWIVICVVLWGYLRRKHPGILGIDKKQICQRLDNADIVSCPKCKNGFLEPQFTWWRYCFGILIPPTSVFILGNPNSFLCNSCGYAEKHRGDKKVFTKINLSYRLRGAFFTAFLINCLIAGFIFYIYFHWSG